MKKILYSFFLMAFLFVLALPVFADVNITGVDIQQGFSYDFGQNQFYKQPGEVITTHTGDPCLNCTLDVPCLINTNETIAGIITGAYGNQWNFSLANCSTAGVSDIILIGSYITGGTPTPSISAVNDLNTIMGTVVNTTVAIAVNIFTVYWPFVLVVGIISSLVLVMIKLIKIGTGRR